MDVSGTLPVRTGIKYYTAICQKVDCPFRENMRMLDEKNVDALFSHAPIYTKIPILFRGVKIGKGARVKNVCLCRIW